MYNPSYIRHSMYDVMILSHSTVRSKSVSRNVTWGLSRFTAMYRKFPEIPANSLSHSGRIIIVVSHYLTQCWLNVKSNKGSYEGTQKERKKWCIIFIIYGLFQQNASGCTMCQSTCTQLRQFDTLASFSNEFDKYRQVMSSFPNFKIFPLINCTNVYLNTFQGHFITL